MVQFYRSAGGRRLCERGHLASILTSVAAIETYLRVEYSDSGKERLFDLIDRMPGEQKLKNDLHSLRRYRNSWVHVDEPRNDVKLLEDPSLYQAELEHMAMLAARLLRQVIYDEQFV